MKTRKPEPGTARAQRLSDQGLARLERQLASGINVSNHVLEQWIQRYGDAARKIIEKYKAGGD